MPLEVANLRREHIGSYIGDLRQRWRPTTSSVRYRALKSFFGWLVEEGERRRRQWRA